MNIIEEQIEVDYKELLFTATVFAKEVDASFDHAFGTKEETEIEIEEVQFADLEDGSTIEDLSEYDKNNIEDLVVKRFYDSI